MKTVLMSQTVSMASHFFFLLFTFAYYLVIFYFHKNSIMDSPLYSFCLLLFESDLKNKSLHIYFLSFFFFMNMKRLVLEV